MGDIEQITPDFVMNIDPSRTKRVLAAVTEIISSDKKIRDVFLKNAYDKTTGTWKVRSMEAVANILNQPRIKNKTKEAFVEDIFKKYNITGDDFANLFIAQFSQAGKQLKQASTFKKFMKTLSDDVTDVLGMDLETKSVIQKLREVAKEGDLRDITRAVDDASEFGFFRGLARSADDLRLAAMTSQTGTTLRNTVSGYGRLGIDTLVNLHDRAIGSFLGKGKVGWGWGKPNDDIFSLVTGLTNGRETAAIDSLFKLNFHKQASSLYRELRDIDLATGSKSNKLTMARKIGRQLNALNTVSDNFFKRIAFVSSIKKQLNEGFARTSDELIDLIPLKNQPGGVRKFKATIKNSNYTTSVKNALLNLDFKNKYDESFASLQSILRKEYDIIDMIKNDRFAKYLSGKEGAKAIDRATKEALYFTYQKTPDHPMAKWVLNFAHKAPFLTSSLVPFPRFIMNAMRFTYEYSPAYLAMDVFGKGAISTQKKLGSQNYQEVAKSLTGMWGLYGAYAFRQSEYAGENWWEGRLPNGNTFDMRPFFPAAPYLFLADLALRSKALGGTGDPIKGDIASITKESLQALSGTQFRAGLNIDLFDDGVNDIFGSTEKDWDRMEAVGKLSARVIGNIMSTYTIPLTPIKDIHDTWIASDDARIVHETKSSDALSLFVNRSLSRLPNNYRIEEILSEALGTRASDEYQTPTKGETIRRYQPFTRQFSGILQNKKKNFVEKELARMKLRKGFLNRNTGVSEADTLINALFGEWTSTYLAPLLEQSTEYKEADDMLKKKFIKDETAKFKQGIVDIVTEEQNLVKENGMTVIEDKYGFNPLKKARVLKKYSGTNKQFLNSAIEAYEAQFPKKTRTDIDYFRGTDNYDWDIIEAFAESFLNGYTPLTPKQYQQDYD